MKSTIKKLSTLLMAVALFTSIAVPTASAASTIKCYTINSGNTTAYSNTSLTKKVGTIYATDELTVRNVTGKYCQVTYPLDRGGTRTAYIPTSSILVNTTGSTKTSSMKVTTYRRNNTQKSYGYIAKGDSVKILGTKGNYTQVKYPVSGGYKYAFITTSDASKAFNSSNTSGGKTLTNALYGINVSRSYISCGFDGYVNTKGRHEGIDFTKSIGSNVYALAEGTVVRVANGYNGSNGLSTIAIYNSKTNKTVIYLHTCPVSGLRAGNYISRGQKIATESWRGISRSSGAHTHVEVRNGRQGYASKSVNDPVLNNSNPASFWNSLGYTVK
jgi:murein DD-endopeptidase MepM/ murein hydrolase activator NlpD